MLLPVQAGLGGGRDHALTCLLALNGLRISEALGAEIDNLRHEVELHMQVDRLTV